ncbi:hypothetical protein HW509_02100 [Asaia spathodeae]|uniref:hypothetical protein n=1 Tax=Asaia spathodeae TaxID=657016 RepID=UPI002FC2FB5C
MVINGNVLVPGEKYLMKIWTGLSSEVFKETEEVTFVGYIFDGLPVLGKSFAMKDLVPGKNQKAYMLASDGQYIVVGAPVHNGIWATDEGDRVTFSRLASN